MTKDKMHRISDIGRAALDRGIDDPDHELILRLMTLVPAMSKQNCIVLCNELIETYGTIGQALEALRKGEVQIDQI